MFKKNVLLVMLCVKALIAFSQNTISDTINLSGVEVKAKHVKRADVAIHPLQSMSQIELKSITGNTVADAVKMFSGVVLKDYGGVGGLKTVMIRSLGSQHTGVIVDGVQISETSTGQIDLGKINLTNAEEVSLQVGFNESFCQPARAYTSANVITIHTENPDFSKKDTKISFGLKSGSFSTINPNLSWQQKFSEKLSFSAYANYMHTKGDFLFKLKNVQKDTLLKRQNTDVNSISVNTKTIYKINDNNELSSYISYFYSDRGLPGAVILYNVFSKQRMVNQDITASVTHKTTGNNRFNSKSILKWADNYLLYTDGNYLNEEGFLENYYKQNEYYVSQSVSYKIFNSLNLSAAGDFFINTLKANQYQHATPTRYTGLLFGMIDFNKNRFNANAQLVGTFVKETTKIGEPAPDRTKLTPAVSLGYSFSDKPNVKARAMYKKNFRMPTFNDLYYHLIGNTELRPEIADQYNLGVTAYIDTPAYISVKTDIFYNKVADKIVAVPTQNLFEWSMQNIGVVDIKGLELQLKAEDVKLGSFSISEHLNYTYQKSIDITPESPTYKHQIPYVPFQIFSANTIIGYKNIYLSFSSIFNGHRYILNQNIFANMLPSWWQHDLSFLYKHDFNSFSANLKFEISNITNKQYEIVKCYPMPGRAFYLTIGIDI